MAYLVARSGDKIEGRYSGPVDLASGRFTIIEKSREFTLVPWRPVLGHHLGRQVSGIMRSNGVSWSIGRTRGMGVCDTHEFGIDAGRRKDGFATGQTTTQCHPFAPSEHPLCSTGCRGSRS